MRIYTFTCNFCRRKIHTVDAKQIGANYNRICKCNTNLNGVKWCNVPIDYYEVEEPKIYLDINEFIVQIDD